MWLYIPSKFAPESACSEKDCEPDWNTWATMLALSATLNGKLTLRQSWLLAAKRARWMQLLSGVTLTPSTADAFTDAWTSSLRASRARIFRSPDGAPASTPAPGAACSFVSSTSPTLAVRESSFWRTSQASLLPPPPLWTKKKGHLKSEQLPASWENWPTAGGMRNGSLFQRPMWAPVTGGNGGSALPGEVSWMTPSVSNSSGNEYTRDRGQPGAERATLVGQAAKWPTPQAHDAVGGKTPEQIAAMRLRTGAGVSNLNEVVSTLPTPDASVMNDAEDPAHWQARVDKIKAKGINGNGAGMSLTIAAKAWPTPTAQDAEQAGGASTIASGRRGPTLNSTIMEWPTSNAAVFEAKSRPPITDGTRKPSDPQISTADIAEHRFSSLQAQATPGGPPSSPTTRTSPLRLNPMFGSWLMGWTSTWVIAEPRASNALATASWRRALASHLSSSLGAPGYSGA